MIRTKNIFALIALGFLAISTSVAQIEIQFEADTVIVTLEEMESNVIAVHGEVTNTSSFSELNLMCTRSFVEQADPFNYPYDTAAVGSYERFCWGDFCFPHGTDASPASSAAIVNIPVGGTNTSFIADFYPNYVVGTTTMEYCFHNEAGTQSACGTITFIVQTNTVEEAVSDSDLIKGVYPNPVQGASWTEYNVPAGKTAAIEIRDITGRLIKSFTNIDSKGKVAVQADELSAGLCFVTINVEGVLAQTEQFVVIK